MKWKHRAYLRISDRSPPTRVVWIEMKDDWQKEFDGMSPPTRVVWIEIVLTVIFEQAILVTTHTGGVD